jgi:hypothetical protein
MRPAAAWDGQSAATHATEAILQRYPRADVSLLVYPQPSVVVPNALINSASQVRASYYNAGYQPQEPDIIRDRNSSPPRFVVDGVDINVPDRNRPNRIATSEGLFDEVKRALEKELGKPSGVELRLRAEMTGPEVRATAHVQGLNAGNTHYKLHIALVEQWVRHSFQIDREVIRVHSMVVRSLAGNDGKGLSLEPVTASRSWTFNLDSISRDIEKYLSDFENAERMINPAFGFGEKPPAMDPSNLAIVAFIQDDDSKEVLQSISVKVQGGDGPQVESR